MTWRPKKCTNKLITEGSITEVMVHQPSLSNRIQILERRDKNEGDQPLKIILTGNFFLLINITKKEKL